MSHNVFIHVPAFGQIVTTTTFLTTHAIRDAMNDLPDQKLNAGQHLGVAFVRRPGGRWIAVMDLPDWCGLYREAMTTP